MPQILTATTIANARHRERHGQAGLDCDKQAGTSGGLPSLDQLVCAARPAPPCSAQMSCTTALAQPPGPPDAYVWSERGWQAAEIRARGPPTWVLLRIHATGEVLTVRWEDDDTLSAGPIEPPQPPRSVQVCGQAMRIGELRNAVLRGLIMLPPHAMVHLPESMKLQMGVDFELRRVGGRVGLFALKNIASRSAISRLHGAVRRLCEYDRIKQFSGAPRPDWNVGQAAEAVPGSNGLCIDSFEHNLSIAAAVATGDEGRMHQLNEMGVAGVCRRGGSEANCELAWTEQGDTWLVVGFVPGWRWAVQAGEEFVRRGRE